jgi:hypothetical protein
MKNFIECGVYFAVICFISSIEIICDLVENNKNIFAIFLFPLIYIFVALSLMYYFFKFRFFIK